MACKKGHVGVLFFIGSGLQKSAFSKVLIFMADSGNKKYIVSKSILNDFTDDALTASASSLFQNGIARTLNTCWWRRMQLSHYYNVYFASN